VKLSETLEDIKNPIKFDPDKKIEKEIILKILEAARWAPSAENQQVWRFMVVNDDEKIEKIQELIKEGDPRLNRRLPEYKEPEENELMRADFKFKDIYYNSERDLYRLDLRKSHETDVVCSTSSRCFIVCCHSSRLTGKHFGETDMGAAIANMVLAARIFETSIRWVRCFNRTLLREHFKIPKIMEIDAILCLGYPIEEEEYKLEMSSVENKIVLYNNRGGLDEIKSDKTGKKEFDITTIDAILDRRAIRKYHEGENYRISLSNIYKIVQAGLSAPLTIYKPYLKIFVVDDPELLSNVANTAKIVYRKQPHAQQVPLMIIVAFEAKNSTGYYAKIDAGAIVQLMLLRAYSLGIGTCWIGAFSRKVTKKLLNVPPNWHMPSLAVFGYSKIYPNPTPRVDLGKLAFHNSWEISIVKPRRSYSPKSHVFSVALRKIKKLKTKTILRDIDAGRKDQSFLLTKLDN
jgi:nitroreductase